MASPEPTPFGRRQTEGLPVRPWRTAEAKSKILIRHRKVDLPRIACNSGQRRMRSCWQDCNSLPLEICINHLIASCILPSAVRVLSSRPHPAPPEPPSQKGKAFGCSINRNSSRRPLKKTTPFMNTRFKQKQNTLLHSTAQNSMAPLATLYAKSGS